MAFANDRNVSNQPKRNDAEPDLSPWLVARLACPWDRRPLQQRGASTLACSCGRSFPVIDGVPILLRDNVTHELGVVRHSINVSRNPDAANPVASALPGANGSIDGYVQDIIAATNGIMYAALVRNLSEYPIPTLRLPPARGAVFVDIGCNWGRWCIAAARLGYTAVGVDPQIEAVRAASRVARQLGVKASFVCADARYLPFVDEFADVMFSYSVLQHLPKHDVERALADFRRVLVPGGRSLVQMPNVFGLRNLYHQVRRRGVIREFGVRYWTPAELRARFGTLIGPSSLSADGFFNLNPQPSEAHLLPRRYRAVVAVSEALRAASGRAPTLTTFADSIYVTSTKPRSPTSDALAVRR